jgi:hypothetical protein
LGLKVFWFILPACNANQNNWKLMQSPKGSTEEQEQAQKCWELLGI